MTPTLRGRRTVAPAWATTKDTTPPLVLVLPLPPTGNHAHAPALRRSKRGRTFLGKRLTDAARAYRAAVQLQVKAGRRVPLFRGPVRLVVHYVLPDWRRRDTDNLDKQLRDALTGVAWEDDCQVTEGGPATKCVVRGEAWVIVSVEASVYDGTRWPLWAHEAWRRARATPSGTLAVPPARDDVEGQRQWAQDIAAEAAERETR